jgi:hypothetical protein
MAGLTCTACSEGPSGFNPFPPPEDKEEEEEDDKEDTPPIVSKITFSDTNAAIPLAFGKVVLGGNIVYVGSPFAFGTELVVNFLVSFSEGPVDQILRVWVGDQLVIDKTSENATISIAANEVKFSTLLYSGTEAQRCIVTEGFGYNVAYRGQAVVFVKNYPLKGVEGRLPEVRIEFATKATQEDVSVDTSTITTDDDALAFDFFRRRVLSVDDDQIIVSDFVELAQVTTIQHSDTIRAETLTYTYDKDIVFQDASDDLVFISGVNYEDALTYAAGGEVDFMTGVRVPSAALYEKKVLAEITSGVLTVASTSWDTNTFATDFTKTLSFTPGYLDAHYCYQSSRAAEQLNIVSIGTNADSDVVFYYYPLHSVSASVDYSDNNTERTIVVEKELFGAATANPTVADVLYIRQESAYILIIQDGSDTRAARVNFGYETAPAWNVLLPAAPPKMTGAEYGDSYVYVTDAKAYRISFADGAVTEVYDIATNNAEVPAGACAYDPLTEAVCYADENNLLSKILLGRYRPDQVTLQDCVETLLTRAGVPVPYQNIGSLSAISLDGYVLSDQNTASAALNELAEFFHLSVREGSSGITISPLALNAAIAVDTEDYGFADTRVRTVGLAEDSDFVAINYFDEDREYALSTQYITKDIILGIDRESFADNGYSYDIPVYTDATTVRRSAELALLRRLGDVIEVSHILLPRYLAVEPSDFVTDSNGDTFRVRSVTTDATFMSAVSGTVDTQENYTEAPAISGLLYNPTSSTITGLSLTDNMLFVLAAPPIINSPQARAVYMGLINPDGQAFVADQILIGSPTTEYIPSRETFAGPVMIGKLVSGLDTYTTTTHTTDYINEVVIRFSQDIPSGTFDNKTAEEIYNDFGANLLFVGQEMVQFQEAVVDNDDRTVTFTGLHRGRFGTEFAKMDHPVGEQCVFYQSDRLKLVELSFSVAASKQVHAGIYNTADATLGRIVRAPFRKISPAGWVETSAMGMRFAPSSGRQGVRFILNRRAAHQPEIFDTSPGETLLDGTTTVTQYKVYILKAPFDLDTFVEEQPKGGYDSKAGALDTLTVSTNTYIHRYILGVGTAPPSSGRNYDYSNVATQLDGIAINGAVHIAIMRDDPTKAIGFTFEAGSALDYSVERPLIYAV